MGEDAVASKTPRGAVIHKVVHLDEAWSRRGARLADGPATADRLPVGTTTHTTNRGPPSYCASARARKSPPLAAGLPVRELQGAEKTIALVISFLTASFASGIEASTSASIPLAASPTV